MGHCCFPPHLLICTHPKSCQPVGLLQLSRVCTPALGEGSSRWEMSAMLGLVSGPTSSHSGGQSIPWWHPPALWIPSWGSRFKIFSSLVQCFCLFPAWPFIFLYFFTYFSFPSPFWRCFHMGKLEGLVYISRCVGMVGIFMTKYISLMHSRSWTMLTDGWGTDVLVVHFSVYFSSMNMFCLPLTPVTAPAENSVVKFHRVGVHVKKSHLFLWISHAYLPSHVIILK